jgi:hypothetical protein
LSLRGRRSIDQEAGVDGHDNMVSKLMHVGGSLECFLETIGCDRIARDAPSPFTSSWEASTCNPAAGEQTDRKLVIVE